MSLRGKDIDLDAATLPKIYMSDFQMQSKFIFFEI